MVGLRWNKGIKDQAKIRAFMQEGEQWLSRWKIITTILILMKKGILGPYGGRFVGETLMSAIYALEEAYNLYKNDPEFQAEMDRDLAEFVGRPSPIYLAENWSNSIGGAKIYFKARRFKSYGCSQN